MGRRGWSAGKLLSHVRSGRGLILALALLALWGLILGRACPQVLQSGEALAQEGGPHGKGTGYRLLVYLALFVLCLPSAACNYWRLNCYRNPENIKIFLAKHNKVW